MPTASEVMVIFHQGSHGQTMTSMAAIPAAHQPMNCAKLGFPTEIGIRAALGISRGRVACVRPVSASLIPVPVRVGEFTLPVRVCKAKTLSNASSTSRDSIAGSFESEPGEAAGTLTMIGDDSTKSGQMATLRPRTRGRRRSFVDENIHISQLTPATGRSTPFSDPSTRDDRFLPRASRSSGAMELKPTFQNLLHPEYGASYGTEHSGRVPETMLYPAHSQNTELSPYSNDMAVLATMDTGSFRSGEFSPRRHQGHSSSKSKTRAHSRGETSVTWSDEIAGEVATGSSRNDHRLSVVTRNQQKDKKVMLVTAKLRQRESQDNKLAAMLFRLHRQKVEKESREPSPSPSQQKRLFSAALPRSAPDTARPSSPSSHRRSSVTPTFARLLRSQSRTSEVDTDADPPPRRTSLSVTPSRAEPSGSLPITTKYEHALTRQKNLRFLEPSKTFIHVPDRRPLTVCMDYPGTSLNHQYVKHAVEQALQGHPGARVTRVQFEARNVVLGTAWAENRWLVTVNKELPFRLLLVRGVKLRGDHVHCRAYDDVMKEEYEKFEKASGPARLRSPNTTEYIEIPSADQAPLHHLAKSLPAIETTVH